MTKDRETKRQVRARMRATGERYTVARQAFAADDPPPARAVPRREGDNVSSPINQELLDRLDRDGFVVIPSVLTEAEVSHYAALVNEIADAEYEPWIAIKEARVAGTPLDGDDGSASPSRVHHRFTAEDPQFLGLGQHRVALEIATRALDGQFATGGGGAVAGFPGYGHQGINNDMVGDAGPIGSWKGLVATWIITSSPGDGSGMRALPGSHRRAPDWPWAEPRGGITPHPDEVRIEAAAGDIVVNSSHTWKASSFNGTGQRRIGIWVGYTLESVRSDDPIYRWNSGPHVV